METIWPSSFHHYQSHHSLGRPLSEVVPTHNKADNLLLFRPNQPPLPQYRQNGTPDYESLEHGEVGYHTASSNVGLLSPPSSLPLRRQQRTFRSQPRDVYNTFGPRGRLREPRPAPFPFAALPGLINPPGIITPNMAKIKFWILPPAFTLSRHSDDVDEKLGAAGAGQKRSGEAIWDEKRGLAVEDDVDGRGGQTDGDHALFARGSDRCCRCGVGLLGWCDG